MNKYRNIGLVIGAFVLFLTLFVGCARIPVKGTVPQYTGLGDIQNQGQGLSLSLTLSPDKTSKPNPDGPVIKQAYAIDRGEYGTPLKIYLEAEDTNGDMAKIATTVDQVGYGHYPTDFIILKDGYRKTFKGYIQWNTFSSHATDMPEWNYVTVRVAVIDMKGYISNEFEFQFTFESGTGPVPRPPAPFDQGDLAKLGNVSIDLYNPFQMGSGGFDKN
jgi:hypothetical protein